MTCAKTKWRLMTFAPRFAQRRMRRRETGGHQIECMALTSHEGERRRECEDEPYHGPQPTPQELSRTNGLLMSDYKGYSSERRHGMQTHVLRGSNQHDKPKIYPMKLRTNNDSRVVVSYRGMMTPPNTIWPHSPEAFLPKSSVFFYLSVFVSVSDKDLGIMKKRQIPWAFKMQPDRNKIHPALPCHWLLCLIMPRFLNTHMLT